jgi:hypothetical protein
MTSDGFVEANQVQQLYRNILHRNPDSAGLANWTAKLESGQANLVQVAQSLIHSPEAVRNMVTQAYTQYLSRSPELAGLAHFTAVSANGYNQLWVEASVLGSLEFAQKSAPTDAAFVSELYARVLGRAADAQGYDSNLAALQQGVTRTELAFAFLNSPEHTASLVQSAYFAYLCRNGSAQEVEGWVAAAGRLRGGIIGVIPWIAGSPEGVAYLSTHPGNGTNTQYPYSIYNLINKSDFSLVFVDGTQQGVQTLQPAEGSVLTPNGGSYAYSIFDTYSIDVRTNPVDSNTSIGTAAVETRVDSNGNRYLYDTTGLLNFNFSADDSSNLGYAPYYIAGQLITVNEQTPIGILSTAPGSPKSVVVVPGNTQLAVTWLAPASNGGSPITDYLVMYSSNSGSTWTMFADPVSTATSCTLTGLTNGTQYYIKVIAKNAVGSSPLSANWSAVATPATVPGVEAVLGNTNLAVSWTAPASNGGSSITDYVVMYSSNGGSTWTTFTDPVSTATSCTVTGLTNGTSYVIQVIAKNAAGRSLASGYSAPATPATVPSSPTAVRAMSGNSQMFVEWTAPASTGGSGITSYLLERSSNNGSTWTECFWSPPRINSEPAQVTGLTNGTWYVFRVTAKNAAGLSLPSAYSAPKSPTAAGGMA